MQYVARFNATTLEVQNLNEAVALSAIKRGLLSFRFTFSLDKKFPRTYSELLARAHKYACAEGAAFRRQMEGKLVPKKKRAEEDDSGRCGNSGNRTE